MSAPGAALSSGRRALVRLSGALAARRGRSPSPDALDRALGAARRDADPDEVEEALLQSYLFLGYPAALDAFARWRELTGRPPPGGRGERDGPGGRDGSGGSDDRSAWDAWARRGAEVCETVYGSQYGALRDNIRALHPDMERWMVVEGYGKVLGRPGLSLATRELCIAALLAVLGAQPQLHSHLRGALNAGAEPSEVEAALEAVDDLLNPAGRASARQTWARVLERTASHRDRTGSRAGAGSGGDEEGGEGEGGGG